MRYGQTSFSSAPTVLTGVAEDVPPLIRGPSSPNSHQLARMTHNINERRNRPVVSHTSTFRLVLGVLLRDSVKSLALLHAEGRDLSVKTGPEMG